METFYHEEKPPLRIPDLEGMAVATGVGGATAGGGQTISDSDIGAARLVSLKEAWEEAGGLCADRYRKSAISRTSAQKKPVPAAEKR